MHVAIERVECAIRQLLGDGDRVNRPCALDGLDENPHGRGCSNSVGMGGLTDVLLELRCEFFRVPPDEGIDGAQSAVPLRAAQ